MNTNIQLYTSILHNSDVTVTILSFVTLLIILYVYHSIFQKLSLFLPCSKHIFIQYFKDALRAKDT